MDATDTNIPGTAWGVGVAVSMKEAPGFARFLAGKAEAPEIAYGGDCVGFAFNELDRDAAKALEDEIMGYLFEVPKTEWIAVEMQRSVQRRGEYLSAFSACVTLGGPFPDHERGWA